jgi:hypothetical protein
MNTTETLVASTMEPSFSAEDYDSYLAEYEASSQPWTDEQAEEYAKGLSTNLDDTIFVAKENESHWFLIGNDCMADFEAEKGIDDSHILYYAEAGKLYE